MFALHISDDQIIDVADQPELPVMDLAELASDETKVIVIDDWMYSISSETLQALLDD